MKKEIIVGVVISCLIVLIGVTYAYFTADIESHKRRIYLVAGQVEIIFEDDNELTENITTEWTETKNFKIINNSDSDFTYNIIMKNYQNTLACYECLEYKLTSSDGGHSMNDFTHFPQNLTLSDKVLVYNITVPAHKTHTYQMDMKYIKSDTIDQTDDIGKTVRGAVYVTNGSEPTNFKDKLLSDNKKIGTRTDFSTVFIPTDEQPAGLYKENGKYTEDLDENGSGEEVYYFVGNVTNNWVKFGKEGDADIWWRIIRTNEDGSVRLLYAGKDEGDILGHQLQKAYINGTVVNYDDSYDDTKNVGYKYGDTGTLEKNRQNTADSQIKETIDTWYTKNIANEYAPYISKTAIYCNDRATLKYILRNTTYFAAYYRLSQNKRPSFKCGNDENGNLYEMKETSIADKFTGSNKSGIGNQTLEDKPIALMTADEIVYAGGVYGGNSENINTYYYQNSNAESITGNEGWWTMSPDLYSGTSYRASVFYVSGETGAGRLSTGYVSQTNAVRPVLSLKSCVEVKGKGTTDDPYIPQEISEECSLADN